MLRDLVNTQAILTDKLPIWCLGAQCFSLMTPGRARVSHPGSQQYPRVSYNHPGRNEGNLKRHLYSSLCNNGPEEIVIFLRSSWEKENSGKLVPARGPVCFLERKSHTVWQPVSSLCQRDWSPDGDDGRDRTLTRIP